MADVGTPVEPFVAEIERLSLAVKGELGKGTISAVAIKRIVGNAEKKHLLGEISSYFRGVTQATARIEDKWAVSERALQTLTETNAAVQTYAQQNKDAQLARLAAENLSRIAHVRRNLAERYQEISAQGQLGFGFAGAGMGIDVPGQVVVPKQKKKNRRPSPAKQLMRYPYADPH